MCNMDNLSACSTEIGCRPQTISDTSLPEIEGKRENLKGSRNYTDRD